nr:MAG TPA: hypothetical protein [Caudoviricetes sp.]
MAQNPDFSPIFPKKNLGIAWENVGFYPFLPHFPKLGGILSHVLSHFFRPIFAIIL